MSSSVRRHRRRPTVRLCEQAPCQSPGEALSAAACGGSVPKDPTRGPDAMPLLDLTIVSGKSFKSHALGGPRGRTLDLDLESIQSHSGRTEARDRSGTRI